MGSGNWLDRDALFDERVDRKWESFSWLTFRALLSSVNDVIGRQAPRLVNDLRGQWVARQRDADSNGRWSDDLVISLPDAKSFLLLGDTGEQDFSQYVVVPVAVSQDDVDFMLILSDVIYPSGNVNDYVDGFYIPYRALRMPIYALPGNHDWYDGLNGFMWNFCGADPLPESAYDEASYRPRERIARRIWRRASAPNRDLLDAFRNERADGDGWEPLQPGPYFAIETADILIVGVDSGITGDIDREQADWLVRVSESTHKPKLMLVGRPLLDKKHHKPGRLRVPAGAPPVRSHDGGTIFKTVDDIARHRPYSYVAAIGGDTHNYQRYDVTLGGEGGPRPFHYVVSGGAGAYMSATHLIDGGSEIGFDDDQETLRGSISLDRFECYPTREESLSYFAALVIPRLFRLVVRVALVVLGVAAVATADLLLSLGNDALEVIAAASAVLLGLGLALVYFRPGQRSRASEPPRRRRALTYVGAFIAGVTLGAAGWWLDPEEFDRSLLFFAAASALALAIAWLVRRLPMLRAPFPRWVLLIGQPLIGLIALKLVVLDDASWWPQVILWSLGALLAPVVALLLVDYLRGRSPRRYKFVLAGVGLVVGGGIYVLGEQWARDITATAAVAAAGLLVAGLAHLHFFDAFSLLWRSGMRDGAITPTEAAKVLRWREEGGAARPSDARTRRIANMVHPGSEDPSGPLHKFVSEIFDKNDPPLYKNFLRVDVGEQNVTITCFHATGLEGGPEDVTTEDPITISVPGD